VSKKIANVSCGGNGAIGYSSLLFDPANSVSEVLQAQRCILLTLIFLKFKIGFEAEYRLEANP